MPAASAATAGGVWVFLDEYRNLGDDFRKNVSSINAMTGSTAKPTVLLQSTAFGKISDIVYIKVDTDLQVDSRPALLVFSVLQTHSEIPYPCQPVCFLDQNTKVVAQHAASIGKSAQQ